MGVWFLAEPLLGCPNCFGCLLYRFFELQSQNNVEILLYISNSFYDFTKIKCGQRKIIGAPIEKNG